MDRALGRNAHIAVQAADQELADLARAPVRLVALEADDQALDLRRQLVGVAHRPARAVAQGLEAVLLVAVEDLVAGLARDAELAADLRSSPRPRAGGRQTAGARPSPNTPSTASTPPARHRQEVLPMCPVRSVTYVSGRSQGFTVIEAPKKGLFRLLALRNAFRLFTIVYNGTCRTAAPSDMDRT